MFFNLSISPDIWAFFGVENRAQNDLKDSDLLKQAGVPLANNEPEWIFIFSFSFAVCLLVKLFNF